jgi:serine/threonine protein kinase/tetratricopeptide (TPR) repeat protein
MSHRSSPGLTDALRAGLSGRYEIERELGVGGMAEVYLARDVRRDRRVALKVLRRDLAVVAAGERFDLEIRLVSQLVHPHILPLLDSGETSGRVWYTMPYIEGESLRARLDREKQLPIAEAVRLTGEIADALSYAHARGILHRDIKPDNILISDGHALVADFGIALAISGRHGERITATGMAVGTPAYMSPEQSSADQALDVRTDLYALGSVCYEMLAGEPPFTGPTAQAVIAKRLSQPAPSLRTLRASVPAALDAVVRRSLAPIPADRFASTADFSRALVRSIDTRPATATSRGRWLLAGGALLLAVAAMAYRLATRTPPSAQRSNGSSGIRLAVVPFRLIGHDSADQYLADGITQEVNSALSNLSGLRVIAQSSVTPVDVSGKSARDIGTALGAEALVEGEVQRAGNAIRVRFRLVDPATGEARWSQQYDQTTGDVFRIQSEVAARVAGLLRIQLAERESRSLGRLPTTNPAAYDFYLRARAQEAGRGTDRATLDSAVDNLTSAVRLDSSFAAAWALRARNLIAAVFLYDADASKLDEAESDIGRAIALDSTLASAWDSRSNLEWNAVRGWHFAESLADERHALALQPSLAAAHSGLGSLYFHYGFHAEAERELDTSLSLDPRDRCDTSTRCTGFSRPRVARVLWFRQQFDSALAAYQTMPYVGAFIWEYAVVLNGAGRPADGLALLDSTRKPGVAESADREAARGLMYAALGRSKEALAQIDSATMHPDSRSHFHHAQFTIACTYARLGRKSDAVEWLRRTAENGMPNYPLFRNDPNLKSLQGDPGYEALMTRLRAQFATYTDLVRARG